MSQIRMRPVELFCLASEGINMHIICCWLPNTLHVIVVPQATSLWEVPLSESRSTANEIRREWQSVFSHLSPPAEILEAGLLQTHCLAMATPYTKAYWFSEISILPLRNVPGCSHSRFLNQQRSSLFVLWGIQWVSEKLREFLFHVFLSPAKKELLLGETKVLAGNPLSI